MLAFISRIVAPIVAGFATWLASKGLDVGPEFTASLTNAAVILLMTIFSTLYGVVHRVIDRFVNPTDEAVPGSASRL